MEVRRVPLRSKEFAFLSRFAPGLLPPNFVPGGRICGHGSSGDVPPAESEGETPSGTAWQGCRRYFSRRRNLHPVTKLGVITWCGKKLICRSFRIIDLSNNSFQIFGFKGVISKIFINKDLA